MQLAARCHCGNISYVFETAGLASEIDVRACSCSFCRQRGVQTVADASGRIAFAVEDTVSRYRFGTETGDFLICPRCGAYVGMVATFPDGLRGSINASLSADRHFLPDARSVSYDGESAEERMARRHLRLTPATLRFGRDREPEPPRIPPVEPPYDAEVEQLLSVMMPKGAPIPPLALFRVLAKSPPLAHAMRSWGSYLMRPRGDDDPGLSTRDREIIILRACARCGCEYEWGGHAALFAQPAGLTEEQVRSTRFDPSPSAGWTERDQLLIRLVDELHDHSRVSDALWQDLASRWTTPQLLEALIAVGWYHAISSFTNAVRAPREPWAARFPSS